MADKWSERFNALPRNVRLIGSAMESRTRIQELNFEKDRLNKSYRQRMREINERIKDIEAWLASLELEYRDEQEGR